MSTVGYTLFDTAIGTCALAWKNELILGSDLPQRNTGRLRMRLDERFPTLRESTASPRIQYAVDSIIALLAGEKRSLLDVELDESAVPDFQRQVYAIARRIPPGSTLTYGDVAKQLDDPTAARAVGQALGRNPFPIIVPCHRVLAAGGELRGFSAEGGIATKRRMLEIEGATLPPVNLSLF